MRNYVGEQLGNYRVLRLLGEGGQASVYLGEHVYLKSQAALKVRHAVLTEEERTVFLQEAQTLVHLTHPHIVRVLDFAVEDGMPFLVMEYAPHGTLRQRHPKGTRLPLDVLIAYVHQVASALQYTHDQGLIHRDVKPENLLLSSHDQVLLSDFGLVMLAPQLLSSEATEPMEKSLVGTTSYLAPEQLRGKAQPASDQYGLGVVVYEWLCGKPPFRGPFLEVAMQHVSVPPPSMREQVPALSPVIEEVVLRALAKEPELRFARVQDFATAFERAYQEAVSPHLTPVLASEHRIETRHRPSSMRQLPTGTVTLLFTDMEGSTQLLQQLGDRYAGVLAECRHLLRAAFQHWNGHEVDTQGDAFFVAFAHATDAILAAVAAQRAIAQHSWYESAALKIRIGLHTGEPQLASGGYVGLDVHHAARIMGAGHGGQVLLSQTTRDLVEHDLPNGVGLRDLGAHRLKDLQHPSHLFQLVISGLPADFPPLKTLDTHPNNLPVQLTSLIGREREVATVDHLLRREDVRLLTLTGPGGIGKTRLGLQVAAELSELFTDGVYFVNLAPIRDPEFVVPTIARTLDVKEIADQPLLGLLSAFLREKRLLIVLDNFEQVVDAAGQVAALLAACPKLKIVVTSRMALHVQAEHEFAVPPLALPDPKHLPDLVALSQYEAVALFIARAQAVKPDSQVTNASAPAIAEICVRLDGLPLAIELAAARIKLLPPQALLGRLAQRLTVLTGGARDVPARQQTLRSTIAWSYNLLDATEQRLFRCLSVFVGGCTLEAVEAVCAFLDISTDAVWVLERVASLIDKSLLQQTEQEGEEPRLVMLETIREYGWEMLVASGEMEASLEAHATYYLRLAEETEPELHGPQQAVWLERLEQEHDNLRAALRWLLEQGETNQSRREMALRLAGALWRFWAVRCHYSDGRTFLKRALAGSGQIRAEVRAKALIGAGEFALDQGDYHQAEVLLEETLALFRQIGDRRGIAHTLRELGRVALERGDLTAGRTLLEEALTHSREVDDKEYVAWSLSGLADIESSQGEYARACSLHEEALTMQRAIGNKKGIVSSLLNLAEVLLVSQSDRTTVGSLLEEGLGLSKELGDPEALAYSLHLLGQVALDRGDIDMARSLAEESVVLWREMGNRTGTVWSVGLLARVAVSRGDYAVARALYEEGLALAKEIGNKWNIASYLEGLAQVVALQGEQLWAARLWGAAKALREAINTPLPPVERANYERSVAAARGSLGEKAFTAAWSQGRIMSPEQALAARGREMIMTLPADQPPTSARKSSPTYPDGLTAREVEVLRLVAQGLTDAQVAEQLVISPRTVNTHLKSIYGKIQVSSRSAATRYAMEHQLL